MRVPGTSLNPSVTKISLISLIVSLRGCVFATKTCGTSASTSIAFETPVSSEISIFSIKEIF